MTYTPGGGGGRAADFTENSTDAVSRPYDLSGFSADTLQQINEMFDMLFKANVKRRSEIAALEDEETVSTSPDVLVSYMSLDDADLDTLNATPQTIISAPGAGKIVIPFWWSVQVTKAVGVWADTASLRLRYNGIATDLSNNAALALTTAGAMVLTVSTGALATSFNTALGATNPTNRAVEISLTADVTQAPTGGTTTTLVEVAYYILGS